MQTFGPPKNRWGWARLAAWAAFALALLWTLLSAVLPGLPLRIEPLDGLEFTIVPLVLALAAGWLEDHYHQAAEALLHHRAGERAAAEQRRRALHDFEREVEAALAGSLPGDFGATARAVLPALDDHGKGEALRFLYEKGLLNTDPPLDLRGVDLSGAVLTRNHLPGVRIEGALLRKARLEHAHLEGADFAGANLSRAFLRHAVLRAAALAGCDFTSARLDHANLEGADLRDSVLEGAYLIRANLKDAVLSSPAALDAAIVVETVLPTGAKATNALGKEYLRSQELATLVDKL